MSESASGQVTLTSSTGRAVVLAAVLGSGLVMLDGTVVNIALRTIGEDLDADLAALQWISNGYLLSLAALILVGGALGDRYGRRRVFVIGTTWFALASLLCGLAPNPEVLIAARVLQGVGAALLTPGSLALVQASLVPADRARAIGTWTGLGGVAAAAGPLLGGVLVEYADWRWIFLLNLPVAALTVLAARRVPESRDPHAARRLDLPGALLTAVALGALTYALVQEEWWVGLLAAAAAVAFVVVERRTREPMLDLALFADRTFSAANTMTFLVYAALGAVLFFLTLQLQTVSGYGALAAGLATVPLTVVMLLFASWGGRLGARIGPRIPLTVGPLLVAGGTLLLLRVGPDTGSVAGYVTDVLPGVLVFSSGLVVLVATLTATVLAAAPDEHAGLASGVNNAVARAGTLLAVAALPAAVGLTGAEYADPVAFAVGYDRAVVACAVLLAVGGVLSWFTIRDPGITDGP